MKWNNYKNISLDIIKQLETKLQLSLPEDYKDVALNFDGGYPTPNHFEMNNKTEIFNNLISLDPEEYGNIYEILEDNSSRIAEYLFPFGEDPFGNLLCIDYSDNKSIVFWDHEINFEEFIGTSYICRGFTEFIEQLR